MQELKEITNHLIDALNQLQAEFDKSRQREKNKDYFYFVQKETANLFSLIDQWYSLANSLIEQKKLQFPAMLIETAKENMNAYIMNSYYADVRKRKYYEIFNSINYSLSHLKGVIERG